MASLKQSNIHGPLEPDRLIVFETRIGTTLPSEYRDFLLTHNGGIFDPDEIVLPCQAEPFASLGQVFALHSGSQSLDEVFENLVGEIPAELLAFAEDVGGNLLCIGIQGEHHGKVYFWDHEGSSPGADEPAGTTSRSWLARLRNSWARSEASSPGSEPITGIGVVHNPCISMG